MNFSQLISSALQVQEWQVNNTIELLEEGATLPFIARYRKERTGSLDEVMIGEIKDRLAKLKELEKRKQTVLDAIESQDKLTEDLRGKILACTDLVTLEDIYLPFKQKRKTRAVKAREKGLEPLAKILMSQRESDANIAASRFLSKEIGQLYRGIL